MAALLKISTAYVRAFLMVQSADHLTGLTGATVTVTLSKAGAAFGAAGGAVAEIGSGWYKVSLNTTDTNTLGDLAYHCTAASADPTDFVVQVSTLVASDLATPTNITAGTITTVTNLTNAPTAGALTAAMKTSVTTAATAATPTAAAVTGSVGSVVGLTASNLDATVSSRLAGASYTTPPTANANADALLDRADAIEVGLTPRQALRGSAAMLFGKVSGGQSGTETFRNAVADSANRLVITDDSSGNRTAVTANL